MTVRVHEGAKLAGDGVCRSTAGPESRAGPPSRDGHGPGRQRIPRSDHLHALESRHLSWIATGPTGHPGCYPRAVVEEVRFRSPRGRLLAGTLHLPDVPPACAVVVCHGMLSSRGSPKHRAVCERAAAAGALALRFDFAGRGDSDGTPDDLTISGEIEDLMGAASFVRGGADDRVVVVGSSMGAAVAVLAAARLGLAGLVTVACPVELPTAPRDAWGGPPVAVDGGRVRLPDGALVPRGLFEDAGRHDVVAAARRITCPWLVLHGANDPVVPASAAAVLSRAGHRTRSVVHPAAGHRFAASSERSWLVGAIGRALAPLVAGDDPFAPGGVAARQT